MLYLQLLQCFVRPWLAYQEVVGRETQIIVRPYPNLMEGRISLGIGEHPAWSRSGKELFYKGPSHLMVIEFDTDLGTTKSKPLALFDHTPYRSALNMDYQVSSDGQRFLMTKTDHRVNNEQIVLVTNWLQGLVFD